MDYVTGASAFLLCGIVIGLISGYPVTGFFVGAAIGSMTIAWAWLTKELPYRKKRNYSWWHRIGTKGRIIATISILSLGGTIGFVLIAFFELNESAAFFSCLMTYYTAFYVFYVEMGDKKA